MKVINQKRFLSFPAKQILIMALNESINILSIKTHESGTNLMSNSPPKDYWEEESKKYPSRIE